MSGLCCIRENLRSGARPGLPHPRRALLLRDRCSLPPAAAPPRSPLAGSPLPRSSPCTLLQVPQDSGLLGSPGVFSGVPGSLRLVGPSSGLPSRLTLTLRDLRLGPGQLHTGASQGISAPERLLWVLSRTCVPPCPRQGPTEVKEDFKMSPEKINLPQSCSLVLSGHRRTTDAPFIFQHPQAVLAGIQNAG